MPPTAAAVEVDWKTAGCAAPGSCSIRRKAESETRASPRSGQANPYALVSASYIALL